jgi:hypothetical protein
VEIAAVFKEKEPIALVQRAELATKYVAHLKTLAIKLVFNAARWICQIRPMGCGQIESPCLTAARHIQSTDSNSNHTD